MKNYKDLESKDINKMSNAMLKMWVKSLYKKGKQITHSEKLHKHDSVFWKRKIYKLLTRDEMKDFFNEIDISRNKIITK